VSYLFSCSTDNESVDIHDLTDGAGHGILIATDNIYLGVNASLSSFNLGDADPIVGGVSANLIYRFKEIGLSEYIGIVQSQQSSSQT
jgi:hypothetical protein